MNQFNPQQLAQRKEVLTTLVKNRMEKYPYLTMKQAVDEVAEMLESDPIKLRFINALAASTTP
jgi:CO/xanthine dehydrogenase Mo-binding subunit